MNVSMRADPALFDFAGAEPPRIELVLLRPDGTTWTLEMSAGAERFVGAYPRVRGIIAGGPLLTYRTSHPC